MKKFLVGLCLCLCLVISGTVFATDVQTQTIKKCTSFYTNLCQLNGPITDSTLSQGIPGCPCEFYIQFDLSGLPKNVQITSAIMELYCEDSMVISPEKNTLTYERITGAWDKNKVDPKKKPQTSITDLIKGGWPVPGKMHQIDITPFVQGWYNGSYPNYGIFGSYQLTNHSFATFTSSNIYPIPALKGKANNVPKLIVKYTVK